MIISQSPGVVASQGAAANSQSGNAGAANSNNDAEESQSSQSTQGGNNTTGSAPPPAEKSSSVSDRPSSSRSANSSGVEAQQSANNPSTGNKAEVDGKSDSSISFDRKLAEKAQAEFALSSILSSEGQGKTNSVLGLFGSDNEVSGSLDEAVAKAYQNY